MGRMLRPLALTACCLSACLLVACGEPSGSAPPEPRRPKWSHVSSEALSVAQKAQSDRAAAARELLARRLLERLTGAIASGGAASAIGVCRAEAPLLAAAVAREQGVRIGRTSHKLRSGMNAAPDWAVAYVDMQVAQPVLLAHPDGRLAALHPIRVLPACLACHGPADSLSADVRTALARDYPADRATGFAEGDLRGWFWVEVPAP